MSINGCRVLAVRHVGLPAYIVVRLGTKGGAIFLPGYDNILSHTESVF